MEKIAIIGNTGFVGTWLSEYLLNSKKKIKISGYSLRPNTKPSIFRILKQEKRINYQKFGNVLNEKNIQEFIEKTKPNKIVYLASQPIVKLSLEKPITIKEIRAYCRGKWGVLWYEQNKKERKMEARRMIRQQ